MNDTLFTLRMNIAALKQFLRDRSEALTEHQINEVLDISKLTRIIEQLEKK